MAKILLVRVIIIALVELRSLFTMLRASRYCLTVWALACRCGALRFTADHQDWRLLVRRDAFLKKNPFDRRPGATVAKVQVALSNSNWLVSQFVGDKARSMDGETAQGLANFISDICTGLARRQRDWLYAAEEHEFFGGGAVERAEHERCYNRFVSAEAAKFEKEYLPTAADIKQANEQPGGICVISIVCALEGDFVDLFESAPSSIPSLLNALTDLAGAVQIDGGYNLYNGEVLWTPSSPDEALFKEDVLLDFPELMAL